MRPISTILAFQLASMVSGYLFAEGCVSISNGRHPRPVPLLTALATHYWWIFFLLVLAWAIYATQAERKFQRRWAREALPLGLGIAGAVFLFFFFIWAGLVVMIRPAHLHG